jgi:hypothetical protein
VSELPIGGGSTGVSVGDERWALVQRLLASRHFQKAPQLRDILLYLCRRAIENNQGPISEHDIGCNVLGRRPDFNANEDNIVRVQVRHLRQKLEEYFATDGLGEPLILIIPKGTYVPHFEPRGRHDNGGAEQPPQAAASASLRTSRLWALVAFLFVLSIALAITVTMFWKQNEVLRHTASASGEYASPVGDLLWSKMFAPGQEVTIVVSDTCLVMLQDILDVDIPLTDYLGGGYPLKWISSLPDRRLREALQLISSRRYTSLGDMSVAQKVIEQGRRFNQVPKVRYARYLDAREFKSGNFILIGSRRGIPWLQLFEAQLNFSFEENSKSRKYYFRNKLPLPGEQVTYGITAEGQPTTEGYADIALLPNLRGTGYVLALSGVSMEMTEAAGELVTSPEFSSMLSRMLHSKTGAPPASYIEILLQANTVPGTTHTAKIVCYRILAASKPYPPG